MKYIFCFMILYSAAVFAGQDVGSGGDLIFCNASATNSLEGYYFLDYVLTYNEDNFFVDVPTYSKGLDRIFRLIQKHVPLWANNFKEYKQLVFSEDVSKRRIWEKAPFGLKEINDEELFSANTIPVNCRSEDKIKLIQAVIRQSADYSGSRDKVYYSYMDDIIKRVSVQNPLQISMLLFHEWLWDVSSNVQTNRKVNQFFHSQKIDSMSTLDVRKWLIDIGITLPPKAAEFFDPNWCQTNEQALRRLDRINPPNTPGYFSYESKRRERSCNESGCAEWYISSRPTPAWFGHVYVNKEKNKLKIIPLTSHPLGGRFSIQNPFETCEISVDGHVHCEHLWDKFIDYYPPLILMSNLGAISDKCVQLIQRHNRQTAQHSYSQEEIVIYNKF